MLTGEGGQGLRGRSSGQEFTPRAWQQGAGDCRHADTWSQEIVYIFSSALLLSENLNFREAHDP